jgi:hypothetical protein
VITHGLAQIRSSVLSPDPSPEPLVNIHSFPILTDRKMRIVAVSNIKVVSIR